MIKDGELLESFERDLIRSTPPNLLENMAIVEALLEEARLLGVWPPENPLEGLEKDLRLARIIRCVQVTA